jgi:hypothetical protein
MRPMRATLPAAALPVILITVILTGCTLFGAAPASPTPGDPIITPPASDTGGTDGTQPTGEVPPTGEAQPQPTEGEGLPPAPTPDPGVGGGGGGSATPGDVLFVRDGQVWAIGQDGSNERSLTTTGLEDRIENLALSPSARYLAFTLNATEVNILDLQAGTMTTVDSVELGGVGPLNWALDGDELFYHKLTLDPATGAPSTSSIFWVTSEPGSTPTLVIESGLADGPFVHPGFPIGDGVLIQELLPQAGLGDWFIYPIAGGDNIVAVAPGYHLWDVAPDGRLMLLQRRADQEAGTDAAIPIYIAELDPVAGALGTIQLSPTDESAAYDKATFGPDGIAILALRREVGGSGAGGMHLGYLLPSAAGPYFVSPIILPDDQTVISFTWVDVDTAVVSTLPVIDPAAPEQDAVGQLWLVELTTGTATPLTTGESPVAIPAQ